MLNIFYVCISSAEERLKNTCGNENKFYYCILVNGE